MNSPIEISDDDDSMDPEDQTNPISIDVVISDDDDGNSPCNDEDNLPPTLSQENKKTSALKKLFSKSNNGPSVSKIREEKPRPPGINKMIGGINVNLPVNPYGCQVAVMSKVITGIKNSQNCLLESPTGSGKTLALLCAALAWVKNECGYLEAITPKPVEDSRIDMDDIKKRPRYILKSEPSFNTPEFGEKSIYDKPGEKGDWDLLNYGDKRDKPLQDSFEDENNEVKIHKKQRMNTSGESTSSSPLKLESNDETSPPKRLPTIYYGARTHKQIAQVIKEFERTSYCGEVPMSLLSSRDQSCIREFDKALWKSKNDMCRGCTKVVGKKEKQKVDEPTCIYYDNRKALNHETMPPAFDIEDLVRAGEEKTACPYYAARLMAQQAHIIFCPYNYLIDRGIRSSLNINLTGEIVIIDEAHNIEDVCRDAGTFTITQLQVQDALDHLQKITTYRFEKSNGIENIESLIRTLKNWEDWFINNRRMVESLTSHKPGEPFAFNTDSFVKSLANHNLGFAQYPEFRHNSTQFCRRVREEPDAFVFVKQDTTSLLETIDSALDYLFRSDCKYINDYKPIFEIETTYHKDYTVKTGSLRLLCLSPAVVFGSLAAARCVVLASGTLAPTDSFASELGAHFPLCISPNHIIPRNRVWVGTLGRTLSGNELTCTARTLGQVDVLDSIGAAVRRVCRVVPHGVLCFLSSYSLMHQLIARWKLTNLWSEIKSLKHVFKESKDAKTHHEIMEDYYKYCSGTKGALLFAVYRGKVSEGMDFADEQARAVIAVGVPFPNFGEQAVVAKRDYNNKYKKERNLLSGDEWYITQAYRALNQAVGRCVRHRADWGAVLLLDRRLQLHAHLRYLPKWLRNFLDNNHHDSLDSLFESSQGLERFIQQMTLQDQDDLNRSLSQE
ncbi:Fanconi anemia group J protein isoform X2 [Manduca sexta]|uniref:Fanconi anemia group J protein isoform X2 n=1 Tax=Manduca sexta TaxID=7130 RepID=UPI00188ED2D0|nr:Fanconi anemia group J protein isoform X2 [Manduca sexta]